MQSYYQVPGGNIKVSRVFLGECDDAEAMEDAVFNSSDAPVHLTEESRSDIIPVQNVCSPAERKESRL